jgi:hypothetical protein
LPLITLPSNGCWASADCINPVSTFPIGHDRSPLQSSHKKPSKSGHSGNFLSNSPAKQDNPQAAPMIHQGH